MQTSSSGSKTGEDSKANSDSTSNYKNYKAITEQVESNNDARKVDNAKEPEEVKDTNAVENQEKKNNEPNDEILRLDDDDYNEFTGELLSDKSILDLLDEDEPVVAKDYKEIQSSFEYPMVAETSGGQKNRNDPKKGQRDKRYEAKVHP